MDRKYKMKNIDLEQSMKYEKINILCLMYLITWSFVPIFAHYTSEGFFRIIYSGIIIIWFITGLKNVNKKMLFPIINMVAFFLVMFIYYLFGYGDIKLSDFIPYVLILTTGINSIVYMKKISIKKKEMIKKYIILCYFVTLCTTIKVLLEIPNASRILTSSSTNEQIVNILEKLNVGAFDFIYGIIIFLPILIFKIQIYSRKKDKIFYLIISILSIICILKANFTTAYVLLGIEIILYLFFYSKSFLGKIFTIILLILFLFWGKQIVIFYLNFLINDTTSILSQTKLRDLINFLTGKGNISDATGRTTLILQSINSFIFNPILGQGAYYNRDCFGYVGGHSQILDEFARYGLLGTIPLFYFLFFSIYQIYINIKNKSYKNKYLISTILFLILGFLNPIFNDGILFFYFIAIPFLID